MEEYAGKKRRRYKIYDGGIPGEGEEGRMKFMSEGDYMKGVEGEKKRGREAGKESKIIDKKKRLGTKNVRQGR